jgi:hypothetical protein
MGKHLSNRRRYLTKDELEKLIKAGQKGRYGRRDAALILLMARHGLRVTEAVDLRWDQIDFSKGHLHVRRLKGGIHSVHPIQGDELRALRELKREQQPESAFVFTTERGGPMTRSNVAKLIDVAGKRAGLPHCQQRSYRFPAARSSCLAASRISSDRAGSSTALASIKAPTNSATAATALRRRPDFDRPGTALAMISISGSRPRANADRTGLPHRAASPLNAAKAQPWPGSSRWRGER